MGSWFRDKRKPSPTPPAQRTVAFDVRGDGSSQCYVYLFETEGGPAHFEIANDDGYAAFQINDGYINDARVRITFLGDQEIEQPVTIPPGNQQFTIELPVLIPPKPVITVRTGEVHLSGKMFTDDQGAFNPRGITFFTWPWGLKNEEARYRQNAEWCAERKLDFTRVWGKVGGGSWADREINPSDPGYSEMMAHSIDVAYDEYGMRTCIAVIADNFDDKDPVETAKLLVEVIRPRLQKIICVEAANEDNMPDEGRNLKRVCDVFRAAFPNLPVVARCVPVATRPDNTQYLDFDAYPYANVASVHTDRTPPPERQVRQIWDAEGHRRPTGSFEPPGPRSSVATMDDPMHLAMTSATTSVVGAGLYVAHLGSGIRTGGVWDRNRGFPANFFDDPQADAQVRAILNARDLLPNDVVNWGHANGHWMAPMPEHPLPAKWVWSDGFPEGVSRTYAAIGGNNFVCVMIAVKGRSPHPVRRNCRIEIFNPTTKEKLAERTLEGGHVYQHDDGGRRVIDGEGEYLYLDGPERGGLWGYIITGKYI